MTTMDFTKIFNELFIFCDGTMEAARYTGTSLPTIERYRAGTNKPRPKTAEIMLRMFKKALISKREKALAILHPDYKGWEISDDRIFAIFHNASSMEAGEFKHDSPTRVALEDIYDLALIEC